MKKLFFIFIASLLLLFSCAEQQPQQITIEDLAKELTQKLEALITSPTAVDSYVKVLASGTDVQTKKSEFTAQLKDTISTLGKKVEYLGIKLYETKATTPIYSFDLGMKPDSVDKVYLLYLIFSDPASQQKSPYTIPFVTLKSEEDKNKIYLAVIFKRDNTIYIYPKPLSQQ